MIRKTDQKIAESCAFKTYVFRYSNEALGGILGAALMLYLLSSILAPAALGQDRQFGSWGLACQALGPGRTRCALFQRFIREDGGVLAEVQIVGLEKGQTPALAITVPLGALLPSGIETTFESGVGRLVEFDRCLQRGCSARLSFDDLLQRLEQDSSMQISYEIGQGEVTRPVSIPVSLVGVREGVAAIRTKLITSEDGNKS